MADIPALVARLDEAARQATAIPQLSASTQITLEVVLTSGSLGVSSLVCLLDNGDHGQTETTANMNLRGKFTTDNEGRISFRSVKPTGYPIPVSGPLGELLCAQGRHNMRPAHIHFLIFKPGFKTQASQLYSSDDPNLETDVQFGVTQALIGHYVRHENEPAPEHTFVIEPGEAKLPRAPITGKATGERPQPVILERVEPSQHR